MSRTRVQIAQAARNLERAKAYDAALYELLVAIVLNDVTAMEAARGRLDLVHRETMASTEVLAVSAHLRKATLALPKDLRAQDIRRCALFCADEFSSMDSIPFAEAVDDLVDRVPLTLQPPARRTYREISLLYQDNHAFAFVRSAEQEVTEAAQKIIADSVELGMSEQEVGDALVQASIDNSTVENAKAWTKQYADMAARTNIANAATVGQFRIANDPDVVDLIPAFRFDALKDSGTRPNHEKADGLIMAVSDPDWAIISPPLEWNCRCTLTPLSRGDVIQKGLWDEKTNSVKKRPIPPGAGPHPEFRPTRRPDLPGLAPF